HRQFHLRHDRRRAVDDEQIEGDDREHGFHHDLGRFIPIQPLALSGVWLMEIDLNIGMTDLLLNSLVQGLATGVVWVPLSVMAFSTLEPRLMSEGMAVFHLLRNIGSSLFISLAFAMVISSTGANYSRMTEMVTPYNRSLSLPWAMGSWTMETMPGLARLAREINRQAAMIGYLNAFSLYTVTSLGAIALVWTARRRRAIVATPPSK
ncbi:MAG: hypothetical protein RLZZ221_1591, partial [Verrucomicrobiota bacterium]